MKLPAPRRTYSIRTALTPSMKIRPVGEYWDGEETVMIWLVHGRSVRDHLLINFTQGGHHYVYNRIPENEIWIDDANYEEMVPIVAHEVHERQDMKFKHRAYGPAHDRANRHEKALRRRLNYDEAIEQLLAARRIR